MGTGNRGARAETHHREAREQASAWRAPRVQRADGMYDPICLPEDQVHVFWPAGAARCQCGARQGREVEHGG